MFGISTKQGGICMTTGPIDICKTPAPPAPPIPLPYPNIAMCAQADAGTATQKVKVVGKPAFTKNTEVPSSSGDEAGSAGGVVSGATRKECLRRSYCRSVKLEGSSAVTALCTTSHNGKSPNAPMGMQSAPSQGKVRAAM